MNRITVEVWPDDYHRAVKRDEQEQTRGAELWDEDLWPACQWCERVYQPDTCCVCPTWEVA